MNANDLFWTLKRWRDNAPGMGPLEVWVHIPGLEQDVHLPLASMRLTTIARDGSSQGEHALVLEPDQRSVIGHLKDAPHAP